MPTRRSRSGEASRDPNKLMRRTRLWRAKKPATCVLDSPVVQTKAGISMFREVEKISARRSTSLRRRGPSLPHHDGDALQSPPQPLRVWTRRSQVDWVRCQFVGKSSAPRPRVVGIRALASDARSQNKSRHPRFTREEECGGAARPGRGISAIVAGNRRHPDRRRALGPRRAPSFCADRRLHTRRRAQADGS